MKKIIYLMVIAIICYACEETKSTIFPEEASIQKDSQVNVRLENMSNVLYTDAYIDTGSGMLSLGNINKGQTSEYNNVALAFRYCFVELKINSQIYTIQPRDYVGEEMLKNGNYTYQIFNDDNENDWYSKLSLKLQVD